MSWMSSASMSSAQGGTSRSVATPIFKMAAISLVANTAVE